MSQARWPPCYATLSRQEHYAPSLSEGLQKSRMPCSGDSSVEWESDIACCKESDRYLAKHWTALQHDRHPEKLLSSFQAREAPTVATLACGMEELVR